MYDISLLHELKRGNREAFNSVFRYYYPKMMAYVSSFVDEETAEDIVQDVFLYVWEHREKLYVSEGFHSYLFQSAYTRCLDYFKKKSTAEKYESHVNEEYANYYQELLESGELPIIDELNMKDFYKRLYELLDLLPEARRKVFILAYIEGLMTSILLYDHDRFFLDAFIAREPVSAVETLAPAPDRGAFLV